jgi:hypothetical protein
MNEEQTSARASLSQATDKMTGTILVIEERLSKLRLGVETWIECGEAEFGYAKVGGEWHLAIRREKLIVTLSDAPRAYRVEALVSLRALLMAMRIGADDLATRIDRAVDESLEVMQELLP